MRARWIVLAFVCAAVSPGLAEELEMPRTTEAFDYLSPNIMAAARPRWRAAADQAGAAWSGFQAWPSVAAGAVYDSNPLQQRTSRQSAAGFRLSPRLVAERQGGVHATVLYGAADARFFPTFPKADQVDGRVGILHDWAPRRDLILRLQGEVGQARDRIDRLTVAGENRSERPLQRRTATLAASVQKNFGPAFVSLGGAIAQTGFSDRGGRSLSTQPALSNETRRDVRLRLGVPISPALFVFAEPAANWRALDAVPSRSRGERLVAGIGSEASGLFDGEVFAGAQRQTFTARPRAIDEPVFGARLAWHPSPAWSFGLGGDRALEQSTVAAAAAPLGTPIDATRFAATISAAPSPFWSATLQVERVALRYIGTPRRDDLWGGDATLTIPWRHDLDLLADAHLMRVQSTLAAASYTRAVTTLGARYRY